MVHFTLYSQSDSENPDNTYKYMISVINKSFVSELEATAWPF